MNKKPGQDTSGRAPGNDPGNESGKLASLGADRLYQEMFASSPDGLLLIDAQTQRAIEFNDAACRQLGYSREEFRDLRIRDYEAAETPEEIEGQIQAALRTGKVEFDTVQRTKAGAIRHVHVWVKRIAGDGPAVLHVIFHDITEHMQTRQALRRSLDLLDRSGRLAKIGGWELDLDTLALRWTEELYRIHEVDPDFQPSVAEAIKFYAPEARPIITAAVQAAIEAGTPFDLDLPLVTGQGHRIWVRAQGTAEHRDGKTTRLFGTFQDITERLQLEAQFRQAQRMESVGQLASGIAHDFNNLLTVINGMSELLLAQIRHDDPVHADVQEIHRAGQRAAALTRQLLAFSRQQILKPQVVNLRAVVEKMESFLRRLVEESIDLVVVPASDVGDVKADPGQLEQVITNLVVNARDAMPHGGSLTIEVQNVTLDEEYARHHGAVVPLGPYVMLSVSDSGIGMDEATRARIFEPFFTTKGPEKGTGLGLSTAYGIVKQSQGFIWVYSEVGQGTAFRIYLPQVFDAPESARPDLTVASPSGTETILLVEDSAGLRRLATRVLEPAGYAVLTAATGEEALRLLEAHQAPIHLLLTDLVMPGMSGRDLVEHLGRTHPALKVLYMSGYTSDTMVRQGVLDAEVAFLSKPFTAASLLQKVREALDSGPR